MTFQRIGYDGSLRQSYCLGNVLKRIHLFYCPLSSQCWLALSAAEKPRLVLRLEGTKPVLVVSSGWIEQADQYLDKLKSLLNIESDQFNTGGLVKAAWYVSQFNFGGATVQKFVMNTAEAKSVLQQLHTMALTQLKPQHKLRSATLWARTINDPYITNIPAN